MVVVRGDSEDIPRGQMSAGRGRCKEMKRDGERRAKEGEAERENMMFPCKADKILVLCKRGLRTTKTKRS